MNVRRFTARTSREALALLRQSLGDDAVVLSTKPCRDGVEVLAMAPEGMQQIERMNAAGSASESASAPAPAAVAVPASATVSAVEDDIAALSMSTLSFQDYVRERMLKRRQAALDESRSAGHKPALSHTTGARATEAAPARASVLEQRMNERAASALAEPVTAGATSANAAMREPPLLRDEIRARALADADVASMSAAPTSAVYSGAALHASPRDDVLAELRSVRGLIEERFASLAYIEKLQRQPAQARLTQRLLDCGFSPALIRRLGEGLTMDVGDEVAWAGSVLERNLLTDGADAGIEDSGGVYALVGATGVGKTTSTAKIAAAFATQHGAGNLGLVTLDAYRVGAHEQLRAYGRILGVPVHTAHDRASLEDLLDLLSAKKMVLIDTAGIAQRDARTRELLDMLSHRAIRRLLVLNSASQGETIEDVIIAYRGASCAGVVLSKMDEAVKLGPALDAVIRHKLKVVGVANGQRVPEDWHRLSAHTLVQRALRATGSAAYRLDADEVSLVFATPHTAPSGAQHLPRAGAL
ncbi:MAG: flagellar biosynthesis protein FlhF [Burkholderiaceae bacterium]